MEHSLMTSNETDRNRKDMTSRFMNAREDIIQARVRLQAKRLFSFEWLCSLHFRLSCSITTASFAPETTFRKLM